MPIDVAKVVGAELTGDVFSWSERDVIIYNLGLGAGNPPTDAHELTYAYEADLQAIPTFGTIPSFEAMMSMGSVEGFDITIDQILHGEHELVIHNPIPKSGKTTQSGRVVDVYDKGKGALVLLETVSVLEKTGQPLFTNRAAVFLRREGGFGGDPGPPAGDTAPDREPDHVIESPTMPQQALLYRMSSGDLNPLHADPAFAAFAGFEKPILHGLCTFGITAKAVVDHALDGDSAQLGSFKARFTGHVFPGETLITRIWVDDDKLVVETETKERGTKVLANAAATVG